jgi:NADH-quinone oxidoreductase subunit J
MNILFYLSSAIALAAAFMAITRRNAFHALLYLVVSLLAVAMVFFSVTAFFAAMLEIIVYAGAIMVLFVFVVMMLNLGEKGAEEEGKLLKPAMWAGPAVLALLLLAELVFVLVQGGAPVTRGEGPGPREVALSMFGPYMLGVELASFLLLAGLVGAYHLGVRARARGGDA